MTTTLPAPPAGDDGGEPEPIHAALLAEGYRPEADVLADLATHARLADDDAVETTVRDTFAEAWDAWEPTAVDTRPAEPDPLEDTADDEDTDQ